MITMVTAQLVENILSGNKRNSGKEALFYLYLVLYANRVMDKSVRRKVLLGESYEYVDIILNALNAEETFQPDSKILKCLKKMETELNKSSRINERIPLLQNTLLKSDGLLNATQKAHSRFPSKHCSKCSSEVESSLENRKDKTYCDILGPILCRECSLSLKLKIHAEKRRRIVNTKLSATNFNFSLAKEQAILSLNLTSGDQGKRWGSMSRYGNNAGYHGSYNTRVMEEGAKGRQIPMFCTKSLRNNLKLVSKIRAEVERNNAGQNQRIKRKQIESQNSDETPMSEDDIFDLKHGKILAPPNSNVTPCHIDISSRPVNRVKSIKLHLPRTDLDWYHDISAKIKTKRDMKKQTNIDAVQLASKLTEIYRQRCLLPHASPHRRASLSSIDSISTINERNLRSALSTADTSDIAPIHPSTSTYSPPLVDMEVCRDILLPMKIID